MEWQQRLLREDYCPETKNEGRRNTSGTESKSQCQCPEVERLGVLKKWQECTKLLHSKLEDSGRRAR